VVDLDRVDDASVRVLPLVARRPEVLGDDPDGGRLRGLYRRAWVENTLLLDHVRPVLDEIVAEGIGAAFLGPAAMARFHDGDVGVRPMDAVDLLVRPVDAPGATRLLTAAGWSPSGGTDGIFHNDAGGAVRLHARSIRTSIGRGADAGLWVAATRRPEGIHHLDAADLLVHALADEEPDGIAWMVDVHHLCLAVSSPERVASLAQAHHVLGVCVARLEAVARATGAAASKRHLAALRRRPPGLGGRIRQLPAGGSRVARAAALLAAHSAGTTGLTGGLASLVSERLDLPRAARPAVTIVHAAMGRPSGMARVARRFGPLGRVEAPDHSPLTRGTELDFTDPSTLASYGATGWRAATLGAHTRGNEARLLLPIEGPVTLELDFAADQTAPVRILVNERLGASTPGRGGPARTAVVVPGGAGTVEVALRSSERRGLWPRPLFVILRSVTVSA
jgi:hypothetical protein